MAGVLHKINSDDKEILTLVNEDKVIQLSDLSGLLSDKAEGEELVVAGYFKSKFGKGFVHKVLVVKKVFDDLPEKVSKTVKGKITYGFTNKLVFLTDEGFPIVLEKSDAPIFFGEDAEATIAYKRVPVADKGRLGDLFGNMLDLLKRTEGLDLSFNLIGMRPLEKKVAYIESIKYLSCDEDCDKEKLAFLGYFYEKDDVLFVNKDKKMKLDFLNPEDKKDISGVIKSLVLVSGQLEGTTLTVESAESIISDKFPFEFMDAPMTTK